MSNVLKLSVSKSKTYDSCPAKYNFGYNLRLPRKDRDYHIFGKFVHKVLEDFHIDYINGSKDPLNKVMAKAYKTALDEYKSKMTDDAIKEAYSIVDAYLKKITIEKDTISSIISVEKNFNFNISDTVILNGMIDRVQMDPDGILHIADYKTTKNKKYLKNDYFQLLTYAYVMYSEDNSLTKIRGSYILLRHNFEYITKDFNIDEILDIKNQYEKYAKMIEEDKLWRPNPTKLCEWCEYIEICDEGRNFVKPKQTHGAVKW